MHLYVYYDVPEEAVVSVCRRVSAMQADLCAHVRVAHPRLMRRVDGDTTWMEVYEDVTPSFEGALAGAVERHGIAAITGPRHIERFTDVDCADVDRSEIARGAAD